MATTRRIFYNAVRGMSREELVNYVSKYAETLELEVLMNAFDELRKGCVLAEEANETVAEASKQLHDLYLKANEPLTIGRAYLVILEGRIKMLILKQYMAKNMNDEEAMFSNRQKITALFTEYCLEGGDKSFQCPH